MRTVIAGTALAATLIIAGPTPLAVAQLAFGGTVGGMNEPPPAADVARRLSHPNLSVRRRGAEDLWRLGPRAKEILPTVEKALADDDLEVRVVAAVRLAEFDSSAEEIVPVLLEALDAASSNDLISNKLIGIVLALVKLKPACTLAVVERLIAVVHSDDRRMRRMAIQALAAIGPPAEAALPALIKALEGDNEHLQRNATWALARIGAAEATSALLAALRDDNPLVRHDAAGALLSLRPMTREVAQALLDSLKIPDDDPDLVTAQLIGRIAPVVPDAIEQLVAMASADHEAVRCRAAGALKGLGTTARAAVPTLVKALRDPSPKVRCAAAGALGAVAKPPTEEVVAALADAMKDPFRINRVWVVTALAGYASNVPQVQALLVKAVEDKDTIVQARAGSALGAARLFAMLKDERPEVRESAARAIGNFHLLPNPGREAAIPLIEKLTDRKPDVRAAAVQALGRVAMPRVQASRTTDPAEARISDRDWVAAQVVPAVAKLLDDSDARVRERAAKALGLMGADAQPAAPVLARALRDDKPRVRSTAAASLYRIKASGDDVRAALAEALASSDAQTRRQAALALSRACHPADVAPLLVRTLEDPDAHVRQSAASALGELGAAGAPQAVPALLVALRGDMNSSAAQALVQIGKHTPAIAQQVIKILECKDRHAVRSAVFILREIGATSATPALIRLAGDSTDGDSARAAVAALAELGPDAKEAVSVVVDFDIERDEGTNRDELGQILRDIGSAAVAELVEVLKDEHPRHRQQAARALSDYGAGAKEALPALRNMCRDDNNLEVRAAASEAIKHIGPKKTSDAPNHLP